MRPQHRAQRSAPTLRGAEEIEQPLLFLRPVFPVRRFDLNLAAQRYRLNYFVGIRIGNAQLERQQGRHRKRDCLGTLNFENSDQA